MTISANCGPVLDEPPGSLPNRNRRYSSAEPPRVMAPETLTAEDPAPINLNVTAAALSAGMVETAAYRRAEIAKPPAAGSLEILSVVPAAPDILDRPQLALPRLNRNPQMVRMEWDAEP
ncbi:hypothetical protein KS920_06885 [Klebsiella pneumoniae]|uniref:hypothetical protein n=1 Tax=Klebsiella pneumoniae TaxID=573 RepID=UPI001788D7D1|nr:hypothetical protein [Klebsiella pneumoniae]MBV7382518.1 hypothetical protein [Klebsiella pneumoniae]